MTGRGGRYPRDGARGRVVPLSEAMAEYRFRVRAERVLLVCARPLTAPPLYSPDGTTVRGISTGSGPGGCSYIDGGRADVFSWAGGLAAGTYTVCIHGRRDATVTTGRVDSYVLSVGPAM